MYVGILDVKKMKPQVVYQVHMVVVGVDGKSAFIGCI